MNKVHWFLAGQVAWLLVFCSALHYKLAGPVVLDRQSPPPAQTQPFEFAPLPPLPPPVPVDPELLGVQVPVPKEMRIYNKSGSQCVWCTIQMLGRIHGVTKLEGLTDRHKHATGPGEVDKVLTSLGVKFKQVRGRDESFIEEYVTKKKLGVGIGVNGGSHVILLCHYDKQAGIVKVIDNSDRSLKVQTWDMQKFRRRFSGWVFVIFPDNYVDDYFGSEPVPQEHEAAEKWFQWWNSRDYR